MDIKSEDVENLDSFLVKGEYSIQEFTSGELEDPDGVRFEITEVNENENKKNNENQCQICGKTFTRRSNLTMHMGIHDPQQLNYNCGHCGQSFVDKNGLSQHITCHMTKKSENINEKVNLVRKLYECPHCTRMFRYEISYYKHLQSHWKAEPFVCGICSKEFRYKTSLDQHMSSHLKKKVHSCNFCEKTFRRKDFLKNHVLKHVTEFINCPYCNMVSVGRSDLEIHVKSAHPEQEALQENTSKKLSCAICKEVFRTRKLLRKHEKTHVFKQRLECDVCGQIYYEQKKLDQHIQQEHNSSGETSSVTRIRNPYVCPYCDKPFKIRRYFQAHLEIHSNDKKYKCSICRKKFKKKQVLVIHMRIHEKGHPYYPCKICDRVFKSERTMVKHEKSHNLEEETMQCPDCKGQGYVRVD